MTSTAGPCWPSPTRTSWWAPAWRRAEAYQAFAGLADVVPRPDHKAWGEERAWGRRLAKRFGAEGRIDDRTFVLAGDGATAGALDLGGPKVKDPAEGVAALF